MVGCWWRSQDKCRLIAEWMTSRTDFKYFDTRLSYSKSGKSGLLRKYICFGFPQHNQHNLFYFMQSAIWQATHSWPPSKIHDKYMDRENTRCYVILTKSLSLTMNWQWTPWHADTPIMPVVALLQCSSKNLLSQPWCILIYIHRLYGFIALDSVEEEDQWTR